MTDTQPPADLTAENAKLKADIADMQRENEKLRADVDSLQRESEFTTTSAGQRAKVRKNVKRKPPEEKVPFGVLFAKRMQELNQERQDKAKARVAYAEHMKGFDPSKHKTIQTKAKK